MGRARNQLYKKKFAKSLSKLASYLGLADDPAVLRMLWAVNALQNGMKVKVSQHLNYPAAAATTDMSSPFAVHKWDIETLALLALSLPKQGPPRIDCKEFETVRTLVNLLRAAEDFESGFRLNVDTILGELPRIAFRQFGWQRGYVRSESLFRHYFIYGQGSSAAYFEERYGLALSDFAFSCFILFAHLSQNPWSVLPDVTPFGYSQEHIVRTVALISKELGSMRATTLDLIQTVRTKGQARLAYLPSALRRFPIIASDHSPPFIISPLPQLIMFRATSGLYYDMQDAPQRVREEVNLRFEEYVRNLIKARLPRFELLPEQRYGSRKATFKSPDVLMKDGDSVVVVFECKATKMTFQAQYAENPVEEAEQGFDQLAKGIAQLWRFFSHARRGIFADVTVAPNAHAVLLSMEPWMQMSRQLQEQVVAKAAAIVASDVEIVEADKRRIVFCAIEDLDRVLAVSDEGDFLEALALSTQERFAGWHLTSAAGFKGEEQRAARPYPFDLATVLPWWGRFRLPKL